MKFQKILLFITIFLFCPLNFAKTKNIIFDVGGVLLEEISDFSKFIKVVPQLGLKCIGYRDLRNRSIEFLDFIEPYKDFENKPRAKYGDKNLPSLMCKWQKGEITCEELVKIIEIQADKNPSFFKDKTEQKLIKKSAEFFLPDNHIKFMKVKSSELKLLRELKNKKDNEGNPAYNLFIISNYDWQAFKLIKDKFPEVFGNFKDDQIIVSGNVKMMKPDKNIFEYTLKKFKLNPKSCIFIDDQLENIEAAQDCGMTAIHHRKVRYTRERLTALGIL